MSLVYLLLYMYYVYILCCCRNMGQYYLQTTRCVQWNQSNCLLSHCFFLLILCIIF